jgi:hypothetical protein
MGHLGVAYYLRGTLTFTVIFKRVTYFVAGAGQCELWGTAPPDLGSQHTPDRQLPLFHGQFGG